jgi:hypothetical protein
LVTWPWVYLLWIRSNTPESIPRHRRIHMPRPRLDPAGNRLAGIEPLLPQPVGHAQTACAVVAQNQQPVVRIKLLMRPGRNFAHRNQHAALNMGSLVLPRLAHIDQPDILPLFGSFPGIFQHQRSILGGNFVVVHTVRIPCSNPRPVIPVQIRKHLRVIER